MVEKKLPVTTIVALFQSSKNKFKYCFEMRHYGSDQRAELEQWCLADPVNRRWGNMGYVECQSDSDAIELINRWGINRRPGVLTAEQSAQRREERRKIQSELGYSRVGFNNR